jgi:hypothetical protein
VLPLIGPRVGTRRTANHRKADQVILGIEVIAAVVQDRYFHIHVRHTCSQSNILNEFWVPESVDYPECGTCRSLLDYFNLSRFS